MLAAQSGRWVHLRKRADRSLTVTAARVPVVAGPINGRRRLDELGVFQNTLEGPRYFVPPGRCRRHGGISTRYTYGV